MSVAAVITLKAGAVPPPGFPTAGYLPVATEADFVGRWLPVAQRARLRWVCEFGHGVTVPPTDAAEVSSELTAFATLVSAALPQPEATRITERADRLRDLLASLDPDAVEEIFIG